MSGGPAENTRKKDWNTKGARMAGNILMREEIMPISRIWRIMPLWDENGTLALRNVVG